MQVAHLYAIRRPKGGRWFTGAYVGEDTDLLHHPTFLFDVRCSTFEDATRAFDPSFPYRIFSPLDWDMKETTSSQAAGWVALEHGLDDNVEAIIRSYL